MNVKRDQNRLVQTLQDMLDRLCSPDTTVAEAKVLRRRVFHLLDAIDESREAPRPIGLEGEPDLEGEPEADDCLFCERALCAACP